MCVVIGGDFASQLGFPNMIGSIVTNPLNLLFGPHKRFLKERQRILVDMFVEFGVLLLEPVDLRKPSHGTVNDKPPLCLKSQRK